MVLNKNDRLRIRNKLANTEPGKPHPKATLRFLINMHCKDCIYDPLAAGTWRQQVALCAVYSCPMWEVRPMPTGPIPKSVLKYYGVSEWTSSGGP